MGKYGMGNIIDSMFLHSSKKMFCCTLYSVNSIEHISKICILDLIPEVSAIFSSAISYESISLLMSSDGYSGGHRTCVLVTAVGVLILHRKNLLLISYPSKQQERVVLSKNATGIHFISI